MSASLDRRGMLDALNEADARHECPTALYAFDRALGDAVIRCVGCRETIWRE